METITLITIAKMMGLVWPQKRKLAGGTSDVELEDSLLGIGTHDSHFICALRGLGFVDARGSSYAHVPGTGVTGV